MQRRVTGSLVVLQCVVACGYAVQAQEARPAYTASPAARTDAALRSVGATVKPLKAPDELTLSLTPRFVTAPGFVRSLVRVAPHAENRRLRISIESEGYFRSSDIELDGDSAPESHWIDFKAVPAGRYEMTVVVLGPGDSQRATRRLPFQVIGMDGGN